MVAEAPSPRMLHGGGCDVFSPNDPVHGFLQLPAIVRDVVDTRLFQRMRHIKQLGVCTLVYPGATHDRFFHSIGTAHLAYQWVTRLGSAQRELAVTDRDVLCVTLAGLCHDLGHPCFSHMFEEFVHALAHDMRLAASNEGRTLSDEQEREVCRYERWTHESASIFLLRALFEELRDPLRQAGLRVDADGDDFVFIEELIDPPKALLEELLESGRGRLRDEWPTVVKGRPAEKAWMYEIVSNWRSGLDVDKFDYLRRDAKFLGVQREFDHDRYMKCVKVVVDEKSRVRTIAPPEKQKDTLRENIMELRRHLHQTAYQHKTVKKFELHMIDILKVMDGAIRVMGRDRVMMRMSEAAVRGDPVAYAKLTDTFVTARLMDEDDPAMAAAVEMYEQAIVQRKIMRLVAHWEVPRHEPNSRRPFQAPQECVIVAGVLEEYRLLAPLPSHGSLRHVPSAELRAKVARFHYGMGDRDPMDRIVFHSLRTGGACVGRELHGETKPLRQKVFVFWNPGVECLGDVATLSNLTIAFKNWATKRVGGDTAGLPQPFEAAVEPAPPPSLVPPAPPTAAKQSQPDAPETAGPPRKARRLKIQASCVADP